VSLVPGIRTGHHAFVGDCAAAVLDIAQTAGLDCDDLVPLRSTNNTVFRLDPCAVVAKANYSEAAAARELDAGRALAEVDAPIAAPASGIGDRVHSAANLHVTFWDYVEDAGDPSSRAVAVALRDLHRDLVRLADRVGGRTFEEQLGDAVRALEDSTFAPVLDAADRRLLLDALGHAGSEARTWPRAVIHGSPHRGNVLNRDGAPVFIDLETIQVGPVEWDLAHLEAEVAEAYAGDHDENLLAVCRIAVSATTATWCWGGLHRGPDMRTHAEHHLGVVRMASNS
jgi:Ser/Thr protein kinase RdoA (MazF antagonist)